MLYSAPNFIFHIFHRAISSPIAMNSYHFHITTSIFQEIELEFFPFQSDWRVLLLSYLDLIIDFEVINAIFPVLLIISLSDLFIPLTISVVHCLYILLSLPHPFIGILELEGQRKLSPFNVSIL